MSTKKTKQSLAYTPMEIIGSLLPSCETALELAEKGSERKLNLGEKIQFKYHGQLCPYCSCKREKLDKMKAEML